MKRDDARAAAIAKLACDHAEDLGMGPVCKAPGWRDDPTVARYIFFPGNKPGAKSLTAAKKAVSEQGGSVVGTAEGGMLIEATPARARRVAQVLSGWDYTPERAETRVPERPPLERARVLAGKAA
jgi:hypothetical protein